MSRARSTSLNALFELMRNELTAYEPGVASAVPVEKTSDRVTFLARLPALRKRGKTLGTSPRTT